MTELGMKIARACLVKIEKSDLMFIKLASFM